MANMLGRGTNPIVEIAESMVAACRQHHARVAGPLVPPMTVHNCPLDAGAQQAASTFWSNVLTGVAFGGIAPIAGAPVAAVTAGASAEVDAWVAGNWNVVVQLFGSGHQRHGAVTRF
eukprot:4232300-Amphidinium_carterae.1